MSEFDMDSPKPENDFETTWSDDITEARMSLYRQYANQIYESFEDFCDKMADRLGSNWVEKLSSK